MKHGWKSDYLDPYKSIIFKLCFAAHGSVAKIGEGNSVKAPETKNNIYHVQLI